jgi:hypothetical protein
MDYDRLYNNHIRTLIIHSEPIAGIHSFDPELMQSKMIISCSPLTGTRNLENCN